MGARQSNERYSKAKKGTRGSVANESRLASFARGNPAGGGDWMGCDPGRLQAVVAGITRLGGAVTFGLSRDRGAHSVTLLLDDAKKTLWFNGDADLDSELETVAQTLAAME